MPRVERPVDRPLFEKVVKEVEKSGPLSTMKELNVKIAEVYNAKKKPGLPDINFGIANLRLQAWDIKTKTKPGKRGGAPGTRTRVPRAEKLAKAGVDFDKIRENVEPQFHHWVDKFQAGSMKAAVALKCIDCCGGQSGEVGRCRVMTCPLHPFRPFNRSDDDANQD